MSKKFLVANAMPNRAMWVMSAFYELSASAKVEPRSGGIPPRNPVGSTLASIWCEALGLDQVGIYDNFFDLGGHSLLATQVVSRVTKTFELDIPLRALFESPTVAGLSALILQKQAHAFSDDELAQMLTEAQNQGSRGSE